ncbi:hypothetical protein Ndes2526A_g04455 [Nannochloris sp. 'desiccata']
MPSCFHKAASGTGHAWRTAGRADTVSRTVSIKAKLQGQVKSGDALGLHITGFLHDPDPCKNLLQAKLKVYRRWGRCYWYSAATAVCNLFSVYRTSTCFQ